LRKSLDKLIIMLICIKLINDTEVDVVCHICPLQNCLYARI
jgi:hypothetical protein